MTATLSSPWVWFAMRATGTVALVLFTFTVVLGILTSLRATSPRWPAFATAELHRRVSLLALDVLVVHIATAVLDSYVSVGKVSAFLPFLSSYRTLWTGMGTLAFDIIVAVTITSLLRTRIPLRLWRGVHWLAYLCWPLAIAHTIGIGTDMVQIWMDALVGLCIAAVLGATLWRIITARAASRRASRAQARTYAPPGVGRAAIALPTATARPTATAMPTQPVP